MLQVDARRRRERAGDGLVAPQRGRDRRIDADSRAVVAVAVGMVEALFVARTGGVRHSRVAHRLDSVDRAHEAAAAHEDDGVVRGVLGRVPMAGGVTAHDVPDRDTVLIDDGSRLEHDDAPRALSTNLQER